VRWKAIDSELGELEATLGETDSEQLSFIYFLYRLQLHEILVVRWDCKEILSPMSLSIIITTFLDTFLDTPSFPNRTPLMVSDTASKV
jgi:hypothetical protein